jgi:hypothetical protein
MQKYVTEYYEDLVKIRDFMKREGARLVNLDFPKDCCDHTARLVREVTGLELVIGTAYVPGQKRSQTHTRNYDPKRNIYPDLTMDQFGPFPEIVLDFPNSNTWTPFGPNAAQIVIENIDAAMKKEMKLLTDAFYQRHPEARK